MNELNEVRSNDVKNLQDPILRYCRKVGETNAGTQPVHVGLSNPPDQVHGTIPLAERAGSTIGEYRAGASSNGRTAGNLLCRLPGCRNQ